MPVITEEGFDTLQESAIQEDSMVTSETVVKKPEEQKKKSEADDNESVSRPTTIVSAKGDSDDVEDDNNDDDDDDEELDETLAERLWGLTEMFPESIRNVAANFADLSTSLVKTSYNFSCNAFWVVASSATILVLPVMFELERAQMAQQQLQQQRQILLGPNAAISGPGGVMPGPPR